MLLEVSSENPNTVSRSSKKSPEAVERGKAFIDSVPIEIKHLPDAPSNLHVDVEVRAQGHSARAVISREHTLFVLLEKDGETIFAEEEGSGNGDAQDADAVRLNFRMVLISPQRLL